jgi:glycosyltransferase involved in cell wall biosynthesis
MVVHYNLSQADEWAEKGVIRSGGSLYHGMRRTEAEVLPSVDGLVFVSEFMQREIQQRIPAIASVPSRVVRNFVRDPGPRSLGGAAFEADLITIGTLEPRKNQGYLLEMVAAARAMGAELRVTVVGDGPDRAMLGRKARRLRIEDLVNFAGFVPDASRLLGAHRAYVHTATMENMPLTLLEALSRGLPVFAPAVGGIPEVFDDGVEGRLLPLDDAPSAARRVVEWLSRTSVTKAADAARRRYASRFAADAGSASLEQFLDCVPQRAQA